MPTDPMSPEEMLLMRLKIAEACGYREFPVPHLNNEQKVWALSQEQANTATLGQWCWSFTPNYPECLNACHEMEKHLSGAVEIEDYKRWLSRLLFKTLSDDDWSPQKATTHDFHAPALIRATAFYYVKNLTTPRQ